MNNPCHNKVSISRTLLASCVPGIVANMGSASKLQRVMKLTAVLLTACCLQVSAYSGAQVSFSGKDVRLDVVFQAIGKQTGYIFLYSPADLKDTKPVTIDVKNVSIETIMKKCLEGQPLEFTIADKTVFVKRVKQKNIAIENIGNGDIPPIDVRGRVINEEGDPVAGVSIMIKGTQRGTYTNGDGEFTLTKVDPNATLILTAVNIQSSEANINQRRDLTLEVRGKTGKLDEVQVVAYGKTSQRFNVGNVTTVKAEDIERQPVTNPLLALQGRVPGLLIVQNSGLSNSAITIQIQGQNSLRGYGANDPLIVIDGIPYPAGLPADGNLSPIEAGTGRGASPLSYINPADVESIDVLKDGDATAIYGSRAANGAILITTKKARPGKTKIDVKFQQGLGAVARKVNMMNTRQYLDMRYEAIKNDGLTITSATNVDLRRWDTTRNTDWQKELIGRQAQYTNANATISGGSSSVQYLVGATYNRTTDVMPGNMASENGSVHFSVNTLSLNEKLGLQLTGSYLVNSNRLPGLDLTEKALFLAPNAPSLFNDDGSLNWALNAAGSSTWDNPLVTIIHQTFAQKTKNLFSNAVLKYSIIPGLDIKANLGYSNLQTNSFTGVPLEAFRPQDRPFSQSSTLATWRTFSSWILEPQLSYKINLEKLKVSSLIGATIQKTTNESNRVIGIGYSSDLLLQSISSALSVTSNSDKTVFRYNALFAQLNFAWDEKYILNLNGRRDGSSRFGPENRFSNFGSIGAGWIFSEEKFFGRKQNLVSFGKLKASYGLTGSDNIDDYSYLSQYFSTLSQIPYQNSVGLLVTSLPNPYLQWERVKKLMIGMDVGLFSDRIIIGCTYNRNRSSNQLLSYTLPTITGFSSIQNNFPATVQNLSWEFSVNVTILDRSSIKWHSNFNLTIPRNKLLAFPNIDKTGFGPNNGVIVGQPLGSIRVYDFVGVDPTTGRYLVKDINGNPTSTPNATRDKTITLSLQPKFYGGFVNNFTFSGIHLDFLVQYIRQLGPKSLVYDNGLTFPGRFSQTGNQSQNVLKNHWQKPEDVASIARFATGSSVRNHAGASNAGYSYSASYIRLENISLSWDIPMKYIDNFKLRNAGLFFQAQNVFTITNYTGLDPESKSNVVLPPLRMLTIGFKVGV